MNGTFDEVYPPRAMEAARTMLEPYDTFKSFTPIGSIANLPLVVIASNEAGVANRQELAQAARQKPGQLSYASTGMGSMHNLTGEYLKSVMNSSS